MGGSAKGGVIAGQKDRLCVESSWYSFIGNGAFLFRTVGSTVVDFLEIGLTRAGREY